MLPCLAVVMIATVNIGFRSARYLFEILIFNSFDQYPEEGSLDHVIFLLLIFSRNLHIVFHNVYFPIHILDKIF